MLICDDKADIRSLVATRLRLEPGIELVGEAANGAEAIARVAELRPDAIILDLQMPVMSGEEVIPVLRSLAPGLRVLVFSAYADGAGRLCGSERPDGQVGKGEGLKPLVEGLRRLLERPPADVVEVSLGVLEVDCAVAGCHAWARLSPKVREAAAERGSEADFLSLVGVFLALGEPLQQAAREGRRTCEARFATRLEAGRAARRALAAIGEQEALALGSVRARLLERLP